MRSLSNLIKSVYFQLDQDGTRKIDSDSRVVKFAPELLRQEQPEAEADDGGWSGMPDSFQAGMNVLNMEDVREEERKKVEEELSVQGEQLLAEARQQADEILQNARAQAEQIKAEAEEAGRNEGFEKGQLQAQEQLREAAEKVKRQMDQERQELKKEEQALEPRYAEIMAALIEKITGVICQDKKEVITYLIHQALNQLDKTKNVTLRVSKNDMLRVSGQKEELKQCLSDGVEFDITEDESLKENQCIIETDQRIIDCSLDVQLQNLKDQIRMITIM